MTKSTRAEAGITRALQALSTLAHEGKLEDLAHTPGGWGRLADGGVTRGESWYASLVLWSNQLETAEK